MPAKAAARSSRNASRLARGNGLAASKTALSWASVSAIGAGMAERSRDPRRTLPGIRDLASLSKTLARNRKSCTGVAATKGRRLGFAPGRPTTHGLPRVGASQLGPGRASSRPASFWGASGGWVGARTNLRNLQEFGHNAEPVKRGRCCNPCNDAVVIPERIRLKRLQDETVRKVQRDREPS
jgi:hypothetical protein